MEQETGDRVSELETRLSDTRKSPEKIDILNDLAWELQDSDPARSKSLAEKAYQLSTSGKYQKEPYTRGLIMSLRGIAHANRRAGSIEVSLSQSTQALAYLKSTALPAVEVDILRNMAIILGMLGNYPEGLEYGYQAPIPKGRERPQRVHDTRNELR